MVRQVGESHLTSAQATRQQMGNVGTPHHRRFESCTIHQLQSSLKSMIVVSTSEWATDAPKLEMIDMFT